eukprot:4107472-Pleurochrysis_carterae.AAC.1
MQRLASSAERTKSVSEFKVAKALKAGLVLVLTYRKAERSADNRAHNISSRRSSIGGVHVPVPAP